ncbi:MAG: IclR family transcriptional regulator, partial [Actinophytocola sp.]|nr:IclR family transcriptional regulator [Actinophytocola sp.]
VSLTGSPVPAAVSVSGPEGRLTPETAAGIAPIVTDVAERLSQRLADEGFGG